MAETDNDHEWLPNPRQTGVIPNAQVTEQMVVAWGEVMNESERIIKGELLIPFWRGDDESRGVNLRKVFLEPRPFDLVLWVQGTAALPYLERGKLTKGATWNSLRREFGSHFPGSRSTSISSFTRYGPGATTASVASGNMIRC